MKTGINISDILNHLDGHEVRPRPPDAKRKARPRQPKVKPLRAMSMPPGALSDDDVVLVRQLHAYGLSYVEIRSKFDDRERRPSMSALKHICRGLRRAKVK